MRLLRILLLPIVSMSASSAYASAWTQEPGAAEIIVAASYQNAGRFYDNAGHTHSQANYHNYTLNPYIEYGYADGTTVGANLLLQQASQSASGAMASEANWGVGDSEFFITERLWRGNGFSLSLQPLIKLPSLASAGSDQPRIGDPHPDAGMGLSGGYGFSAWGLNHYIDIDSQYRYRFGPQKDQVRISATAGIGIAPKWALMPQLFTTWRIASPANAAFTESSSDDYNLVRLQLSAVYAVSNALSVQVGGFSDVDGKNVDRSNGVLIALWTHL